MRQQYSEMLGGDQKYNVNLDLPCGVCVFTLRRAENYCVEEWSVGHVI